MEGIYSSKTSIHVMALDEMLGANSLAASAVLIGLFVTPTVIQSNSPLSSCSANQDRACNLVVFEVISFSCFLSSTLVTLGLKHAMHIINSNDQHEAFKADVHPLIFKIGMIGSTIVSVIGGVFFFSFKCNCDTDQTL